MRRHNCHSGCFVENGRNQACDYFKVDVRPEGRLSNLHKDAYWFSWTRRLLPYDEMVMMAMIVLKHHLEDSVTMESGGSGASSWE